MQLKILPLRIREYRDPNNIDLIKIDALCSERLHPVTSPSCAQPLSDTPECKIHAPLGKNTASNIRLPTLCRPPNAATEDHRARLHKLQRRLSLFLLKPATMGPRTRTGCSDGDLQRPEVLQTCLYTAGSTGRVLHGDILGRRYSRPFFLPLSSSHCRCLTTRRRSPC